MLLVISFANITRLGRKGIRLTFAEALRTGAVTTVACFDKTGTLTGSMVRMFTSMLLCYRQCGKRIHHIVAPAPDEARICLHASA